MAAKKKPDFLMLNADVKTQDMSISGYPQDPLLPTHLSVQIGAIVRNGDYKGKELELQVSRDPDYDVTSHYPGALFQSKPCLMFVVKTDSERFDHLVTLIAAKALKDLYLCFEPPRYGKAKVISWQLGTSIDE